jgi:hypothetical protein
MLSQVRAVTVNGCGKLLRRCTRATFYMREVLLYGSYRCHKTLLKDGNLIYITLELFLAGMGQANIYCHASGEICWVGEHYSEGCN